jgi:hypothetical protein
MDRRRLWHALGCPKTTIPWSWAFEFGSKLDQKTAGEDEEGTKTLGSPGLDRYNDLWPVRAPPIWEEISVEIHIV